MQSQSQSTSSAVPPVETILTTSSNISYHNGYGHPTRSSESITDLKTMTSRSSLETFGYGQLEDVVKRTCQDQSLTNISPSYYCFELQPPTNSFQFFNETKIGQIYISS